MSRREDLGIPHCREHSTWRSMWYRCSDPNDTNYKNYGARGIKVCDRWYDFFVFVEDMGRRPEGKTLDRKDNNAGYSPENCVWSTPKVQSKNKRQTHKYVTINGVTKKYREWLSEYKITGTAVWKRTQKGMSIEDAITTPLEDLSGTRVEIDGVDKNVMQWCDHFSLSYNTIMDRVHRNGMDIKEAILSGNGRVAGSQDLQIEIDGVVANLSHWCRKYKIPVGMVRKRIDTGWDKVKAITTPRSKKTRSDAKMLVMNGIEKPLNEWLCEYEISRCTYRYRTKKCGMTPEEALTKPLRHHRNEQAT